MIGSKREMLIDKSRTASKLLTLTLHEINCENPKCLSGNSFLREVFVFLPLAPVYFCSGSGLALGVQRTSLPGTRCLG